MKTISNDIVWTAGKLAEGRIKSLLFYVLLDIKQGNNLKKILLR
jgi:hypothetical protein